MILISWHYFSRISGWWIIYDNQRILLIKRRFDPYKNCWALPGGFVEYGETTEDAIIREVQEETGLKTKIRRLIGVYSAPDRDPRGHTISVVYELESVGGQLREGDDSADVNYFNINQLPLLSFDHKQIIMDAMAGK